ncbi:hypothetical protein H9Q69_014157 [Fusarium xylarioides]|uniref:C2H2-type domain-containing protein n=1 Tax=Fusarium xylarioides TaxID=221167 RepID=A0A9P7L334_9HYPO|nr:hypothetical protein H9Q70_008024 [Fusarium xylarioides]KAG5759356.1 hypothetical protein H9Q72_012526 [Fusarium xylarioides]KAG5775276.1 hypothetical protein H9Q73_011059 [Fusarium xylarioides]KAG5786767.1 hypothetical protein H9Q69_014157 [Fusarium xylarioides]KAG5803945.1 hypothetical protein H9Q71_011470 [Fusarium xylarioides]
MDLTLRRIISSSQARVSLTSVPGYQTGVTCPFCPAQYNTAGGVVHHLEQGACPNAPLNRDPLHQQVGRQDPPGSIVLLLWRHVQTAVESEPASGLSSSHQQEIYHCPNRGCHRVFTTLAGVVTHLESESCGFLRFDAFQYGIRGSFSSGHWIAF